jgi:FtsP/CotA-like multicopper oxidase with cupredoxin domain
MNSSTTNLHFHGMAVAPDCHQDDVLRTAIAAGAEYDYRIRIPRDEPPGLYWYHPHPHGFSERQVQGGAAGALIIEGLDKVYPALAKLPERVLVLRDQTKTDYRFITVDTPAWDISLNYVPIVHPVDRPAVVATRPAQKEFWRLVNAGADTIFNLQLLINGIAQPVQIVALDGVPSPAPKPGNRPKLVTSILLPPGARAEFIVTTPSLGETAQLVTTEWDTGPEGDRDPARPIANIVSSAAAPEGRTPGTPVGKSWKPRSARAAGNARPLQRKLYFSQASPNPLDPDSSVFYFLTQLGDKPQSYRMGQPPDIVVHQGASEDWTVENRAAEDHVFHIHQLHFQVLEQDGKPVDDPSWRDTINIPHWSGSGPYPSVKLHMDFSNPDIVGAFMYHCHILKHEDMGMAGVIQVLSPGLSTTIRLSASPGRHQAGDPVTVTAKVEARETAPTGVVQFIVDGIYTGRPVPVSQGQAVLTSSFGDGGTHVFEAMYFGDTQHNESASAPLKLMIDAP